MSASAPSTVDELLGHLVLGRYRILRPLARGGMGVVYLARLEGAAGFSRPVVIKRIVPDLTGDSTMSQLFVREARILSHLQHPDIVAVVDFGEENMAYVMVLEYVHGYNLGQWHRYVRQSRGHLPVAHANHIVIKTLEALHFAHTFRRPDGTSLKIIHRDVSPSNILLDLRGSVKLHDFGIARTEDANEYKTTDGAFKGKLAFTAPEIFSGEPASPESDVYACGVVLYQLLTATNPFRSKEMGETVSKVLTYNPPPISAYRDEVPDGLDEIVARSLSKKREDRFRTAADFAEALRRLTSTSEAELTAQLAKVFNEDFALLPQTTQVDSLEERDRAWRESQDLPSGAQLPLSSWPPTSDRQDATRKDSPLARAVPSPAPALHTEEPARRRSSLRWLTLVGILLAVATAVVSLVFSLKRPAAPTTSPRFLVVEKNAPASGAGLEPPALPQGVEGPAVPPEGSGESSAPSSAPEVTPRPPGPGTTPTPRSSQPQKPDPAQLSKTFAAHQGKVQQCFLNHADSVSGQPQVSIRFRVDKNGSVQSAAVEPAHLSGTALGQCIVGVAKTVKFGPLSEPVTFTIPITARRVQR